MPHAERWKASLVGFARRFGLAGREQHHGAGRTHARSIPPASDAETRPRAACACLCLPAAGLWLPAAGLWLPTAVYGYPPPSMAIRRPSMAIRRRLPMSPHPRTRLSCPAITSMMVSTCACRPHWLFDHLGILPGLDAKHVRPRRQLLGCFGGAIAPNLILYGEVLGMIAARSPSVFLRRNLHNLVGEPTIRPWWEFGPGWRSYLSRLQRSYLSGTSDAFRTSRSATTTIRRLLLLRLQPEHRKLHGRGFQCTRRPKSGGSSTNLGPRWPHSSSISPSMAGRQQRRVD